LADAAFQDDGPLIPNGQILSSDAVNDLTAWATDKGVLAIRSAQTLAVHFERLLNEGADESVIQDLQEALIDPHASAALRMELAQLLKKNNLGQPLPAIQSRQAAEVTRRVMTWAVQAEQDADMATSDALP
jgi:hypothetical protein